MNAKLAVPMRATLEEMGHPQPPTPIKTDNTTANGIINGSLKQQRSKAIDMRFYWLRDRVQQGQFKIYWAPGEENWGDYYTKHHPPIHHIKIRPCILNEPNSPNDMQGCVDILKARLTRNPARKSIINHTTKTERTVTVIRPTRDLNKVLRILRTLEARSLEVPRTGTV